MTGLANIHIWMRNGTAYCTSLYLTFRAENHMPKPTAFRSVTPMMTGASNTPGPSATPYQSIIARRTAKPMRKSMSAAMAELAGIMSRGKYTFETRLAPVTKLVVDWLRTAAKEFQRRRHGRTKMGE